MAGKLTDAKEKKLADKTTLGFVAEDAYAHPPKTYASMASQLKLSIPDFDSLLDCPLKLEQYLEALGKQGLLGQ